MSGSERPDEDEYAWLEQVHGERAMAWVRERNAETRAVLQADTGYTALRERLLAVLNSRDRIPQVARRGDRLYNFWQDEAHPRGLWRRTTPEQYRQPQPQWEVLLDLDALAQAEGESWVWHGSNSLAPGYGRALLSLSRGGADAVVVREFDLAERRFVDGGFALPEAKSSLEWIDADTVYVATDFGPGSLTDSGYPRLIKRWHRGTPLQDAVTVFEAEPGDVSASVYVDRTPGFERSLFIRALDFYHTRCFLMPGRNGALEVLDAPSDASVSLWRDRLLLELRSDLTAGGRTHPRGSLLAIELARFLAGERDFVALFTPSATRSLAGFIATRHHVVLNLLDNVAGRLEEWDLSGDRPLQREIETPYPGTLSTQSLYDPAVDEHAPGPLADTYAITYSDFLTPDTLYLRRAGTPDALEPLKAREAYFDAAGMRVEQCFATSRDGTRVPYFVVWPAGAQADRENPTLLYGYGGFEVSIEPWYSGGFGSAWYARGGVLVVANIRGGGEFGPAWHQAALRERRQRSFDDFIAVAEDLFARGITRPRRLAIQGGSNGGLLVGATFTQRPELYAAVVCQVPLLDMQRYHRLLAGASWMAEYGNPDDPQDWAWLQRYSPYHNLHAGVRYPSVLFTTSTRDDRVHPGHARKMAARMRALGHEPLYYENIEGGHGGGADNEQLATMMALEFTHLWRALCGRTATEEAMRR